MEKLISMICDELADIEKKGQLSAGDVDAVYKLAVAKEKLLRAEELEEELGYSQGGGWTAQGNYNSGNSYGRHYVKGHYSRGNMSYSGAKAMMADSLRDMSMDDGLGERERDILRRAESEMRR